MREFQGRLCRYFMPKLLRGALLLILLIVCLTAGQRLHLNGLMSHQCSWISPSLMRSLYPATWLCTGHSEWLQGTDKGIPAHVLLNYIVYVWQLCTFRAAWGLVCFTTVKASWRLKKKKRIRLAVTMKVVKSGAGSNSASIATDDAISALLGFFLSTRSCPQRNIDSTNVLNGA